MPEVAVQHDRNSRLLDKKRVTAGFVTPD